MQKGRGIVSEHPNSPTLMLQAERVCLNSAPTGSTAVLLLHHPTHQVVKHVK